MTKTPTKRRDEMLEWLQPALGEVIDRIKELDNVAQIWVRPERTYCKIKIATWEKDMGKNEKIYDIEKEGMARSDVIYDFNVIYTPQNIDSNWRYKVFYDNTN